MTPRDQVPSQREKFGGHLFVLPQNNGFCRDFIGVRPQSPVWSFLTVLGSLRKNPKEEYFSEIGIVWNDFVIELSSR